MLLLSWRSKTTKERAELFVCLVFELSFVEIVNVFYYCYRLIEKKFVDTDTNEKYKLPLYIA